MRTSADQRCSRPCPDDAVDHKNAHSTENSDLLPPDLRAHHLQGTGSQTLAKVSTKGAISGRRGLSTWCIPRSRGEGTLNLGAAALLLGSAFALDLPAGSFGTCGMQPAASESLVSSRAGAESPRARLWSLEAPILVVNPVPRKALMLHKVRWLRYRTIKLANTLPSLSSRVSSKLGLVMT